MNYGKAIKELRLKKGETQMEFSEKTGISQAFISNLENGRTMPSVETLDIIATHTQTPVPIIAWMSLEEKDIPENKKEEFNTLKPFIDAFCEL